MFTNKVSCGSPMWSKFLVQCWWKKVCDVSVYLNMNQWPFIVCETIYTALWGILGRKTHQVSGNVNLYKNGNSWAFLTILFWTRDVHFLVFCYLVFNYKPWLAIAPNFTNFKKIRNLVWLSALKMIFLKQKPIKEKAIYSVEFPCYTHITRARF